MRVDINSTNVKGVKVGDKIKYYIIIICIIICILLISIIAIKLLENNKQQQADNLEIQAAEKVTIYDIEKEERIYKYLLSNEILDRIFDYISEEEKNVKNEEALINLLDKEYKEKNNITESNVLDFLKSYKNINSYSTKEIYKKEIAQRQNLNGSYFYIKGIIRKNSKEEYIYILMKEDYINSTYSISILTEEEFNVKGNDNRDILIEKNNYNSIYSKGISDYQICLEYLRDYINAVINSPDKAYELLNEEYKEERFGSIENYTSYINKIKGRLSTTVLKNYSIEKQDNKTQYVCVDQRGNYYIFEKKEMMNYAVILDTYTIESSQFLEKYNKADTMEKVGYNIQKCIESINNKDYSYIYNKLDSEFKTNNYKTEKDFENIIKDKLFDTNKITNSSCSNEGNIYIYSLNISDTENEANKQDMTIIMQLAEGTDFVMSFSFE